jgi:hypothetical protein
VPLSDLQTWLCDLPGFQSRLERVIVESVAWQFPALNRVPSSRQIEHDWQYLLLCGSVLATSLLDRCQDGALRIAQHCLTSRSTSPEEKDAAAVILDALTNKPAIRLAEQRSLLEKDIIRRLPLPLQEDMIRRTLENTIALPGQDYLGVNRFQKQLWDMAEANDWISVSAPTSAGKTYIVKRWLEVFVRTHPRANIVYLVPTRALIQEVESDLRRHFAEARLSAVNVSSFPLTGSLLPDKANVFVFTQERYHLLLMSVTGNFAADVLVVDEAQKLGDRQRGVLLQQVIDESIARRASTKVFFLSPLTANPEVLIEDCPAELSAKSLASEQTTVNQNLLWVSQVWGQPKLWKVELSLKEKPIEIGTVGLPNSPAPESKRLTFVAHAMAHKGGNLVYVNGAAAAEKAAAQLFDLADGEQDMKSNEIADLIELIKKTIHKDYALATVLSRGIAFHYGNMPLLVRTEIERLFRENVIRFLVCTSTLLEGVNMPCCSIFVRGPQKGRGKPMTPADFWNLAGRAGRWGKEFQGNIVCVDPLSAGVWKDGPPKSRVKYMITRTAQSVVRDPDNLIEFIVKGTPREMARERPDLEYVASYIINAYLRSGSIAAMPLARHMSAATLQRLETAVSDIAGRLRPLSECIRRNPGISPLAMENLLKYFQDPGKPIENLLPVAPESDNAMDVYAEIFDHINAHLGEVFGVGKRVKMLALVVTLWMRGYSLARLIRERIDHYRDDDVSKLIRDTMADVEQIARFQAPRHLSCYCDLLRHFLGLKHRDDLIGRIPDLSMLLEFGVSQGTQMSLIVWGLSRTSAIAVSELIARDGMSLLECDEWLKKGDWRSFALPALVKREVEQVLATKLSQSS